MKTYQTHRSTIMKIPCRLVCATLVLGGMSVSPLTAEIEERELTVERGTVNFTGSPAQAMTVNGGIPGPTLRFTEGHTARIQVHNKMDVETSIHWHGLLVPPDMDGVPNLTFPPIPPGSSFVYEFPIRQSGTYWYHSHTALQEQRGVYGSIVITPEAGEADSANRDHVVMLSDWTDTDPKKILHTLRRGSEWYALERGTGQSILGAARAGRLGDYFSRELQRMPAMDIADVAYDRFLANGKSESSLPAEAGETVRLRLINGSATTFFHIQMAGGPMTVISADGIDVEPFELDRLLISVAETYDVLVRIPGKGAYELRSTAHDGSGYSTVWLGQGQRHSAPSIPYPDLYQNMGKANAKNVFALTPAGTMGMPTPQVKAGRFDAPGMNMDDHGSMDHGTMDHGEMDHGEMDHGSMDHGSMDHGSMDHGSMDHGSMDHGEMNHGEMNHGEMDHGTMDHGTMDHGTMDHETMDHGTMDHGTMDHENMDHGTMDPQLDTDPIISDDNRGGKGFGSSFGWLATDLSSRSQTAADGMSDERPWPPYRQLRARKATSFDPSKPIREIRLTLDGDMERYVWFLNGKALSESDDIKIHQGEIVRFIMINRTMMHHPMHLHGHFFRVINGQGDFAPLKHTVDVEPMSTTVIEFDANEVGDWFFHCHLLYHMKSGMTRVVSYQSFVPAPEVQAVRPKLYREHWYAWGEAELMSHMSLGSVVAANTRNILAAEWEVGWQNADDTQIEVVLTWDRYVNRFFTYFIGLDVEGESDQFDDPKGVAGLRYLLPFGLESRLWIDTEGEARLALEKMLHFTPRLALQLEAEYDTVEDWEGLVRTSYTLNQRIDLLAQWHSRYGWGGGLTLRF